MKLLFVYGTLLEGLNGHAELLPGLRPIARTQTRDACYRMVTQSTHNWPFLLSGGSSTIKGEVFEVSDEKMRELDEYEECPQEYVQEVIHLEGGIEAIYYRPTRPQEIEDGLRTGQFVEVPNGDWKAFKGIS